MICGPGRAISRRILVGAGRGVVYRRDKNPVNVDYEKLGRQTEPGGNALAYDHRNDIFAASAAARNLSGRMGLPWSILSQAPSWRLSFSGQALNHSRVLQRSDGHRPSTSCTSKSCSGSPVFQGFDRSKRRRPPVRPVPVLNITIGIDARSA